MSGLALSKLLASSATITLHTATADFTAGAGGDITYWADRDGFMPRDVMIFISNVDDQSVQIASPTLLVNDGTNSYDRGLLFATSPITIPAGERLAVLAPKDSAALGHIWRLTGTITPASGTAQVTVTARVLQVTE